MICEMRSSRPANSAFPSFELRHMRPIRGHLAQRRSPSGGRENFHPEHFGHIFLVHVGVKLLRIDEIYLMDRYNPNSIHTGAACSRRHPSVKPRN